MTDEAKLKMKGWGTAIIGIPLSVLLTIVFMGGIKMETLNRLQDDVSDLKSSNRVHEKILQQQMPLINYKLELIECQLTEVKSMITSNNERK